MDVSRPALLIPGLIGARLPSSGLTLGSDRGHHGKARPQPFDSALGIVKNDLDRHALRHFLKLPVALSGGSKANVDPLAGAICSTRPLSTRPGNASTRISAGSPARICWSCVSR